RAVSSGWRDPRIVDDDLGTSASGYDDRPGFNKMLTMVAKKQVGIIFCIEASRLSRNDKDWAHLFQLCGFFDTLVADNDQIFDLNQANDRLVLGIKGTMSELELSTMKARMNQGLMQKAARGELKIALPPGYCYDHDDKIVIEPDIRIQSAIRRMFDQFKRQTSVRQLTNWYIENDTTFPVRKANGYNPIVWQIPKYDGLRRLLKHPIYAGVYVYGRTQTVHEYKDGAIIKRTSNQLPFDQCKVFIKDHHEPYVDWDEFLEIQTKISQNRPRWKMTENLGAIREGLALFVGLLRCGNCGKKLYVAYKTKKRPSAMYYCRGYNYNVPEKCLSIGAHSVDKAIGKDLLKAFEPAAIEAGFAAIRLSESENKEKIKSAELEIQNAQYQAQRAFEQYDLADPKNRLVVDTLEKRYNDRLVMLKRAEEKREELKQAPKPLTEAEKQTILSLSRDFEKVWNHEETEPKLKKQLIRLFIKEIIVAHNMEAGMLELIIHWQGGVHTKLSIIKRKVAPGNKTDQSLTEKVAKLAECMDDAQIARVLNMSGEYSSKGLRWSKDRVINFRHHHRIHATHRQRDKPDVFSAERASEYLGVSRKALIGLIKRGFINKNQVMPFAPWQIQREQLDSEEVQQAVANLKATGRMFPDHLSSEAQMSLFHLDRDE
ncbi:MAG: recombinase family protein, partial [Planctomycetes bacterium]|nr:recombinase family protein [Planctomycetota bacterium]